MRTVSRNSGNILRRQPRRRVSKGERPRPGSTNVFADLGVRAPEEALAKARLASAISDSLQRRRLNQTDAAHLLALDQPKVSNLLRGRLTPFSLERLMAVVRRLGHDVDVRVRPGRGRPGRLTVTIESGSGRSKPY